MELYWWLVIVVVGGIIGLVLVQSLIGRAINITDAGRLYLSAELKKMGIRHLFPNELVIELADRSSSTASMMAKMDGKSTMTAKTEMVSFIDSQVMQIGMWLRGDDLVKKQKSFAAVMEKYSVPFGAASRR
jgi:hypothetical protein